MNELQKAELFARDLPLGSEPACSALARLEALTREQRALEQPNTESLARARSEARAVYARLLEDIAPLAADDRAPSLGPPAELRARFVDSVLLWMQFYKTSSVPLFDSIGTRSIRAFPLDLPPDDAAHARLARALAKSQGLSPAELADSLERVERLTQTLRHKLTLCQALAARLQSELSAPEACVELMREFYGALPLRPGDVDVVITTTALFFVVPIHGDDFDVADWDARPAAERESLQAFVKRFARENLKETWRFPAFGLFDPNELSSSVVDHCAAATGVAASAARKMLATMVSILPRAEIDQYLVHDAWGHTWQEVLNEFELDYAKLRSISEPLSLDDGPGFGGPSVAALGAAFGVSEGRSVLDEARLLDSARADLEGRIQVGLSQVLSEVLADFVEAKFSRLNPASPLPTSSLLATGSMKLDLSIQDMLRQARRCSRPYRDLWSKASERERWVRALLDRGLPEAGLEAAVARAASALESSFGAALRPAITGGRACEPGSTVATRALLELTLLCRELERVLDAAELRPAPAWTRPERCPDLWAVSLSHMYEADRQNRFWCLDTLLRTSLRGACEALGRELDCAGAEG